MCRAVSEEVCLFRYWTFNQRLIAVFLVTLVTAMAISTVSLLALRSVTATRDRINLDQARDLILAQSLQTAFTRRTSAARVYFFSGQRQYLGELSDAREDYDRLYGRLDRRTTAPRSRELLKELHARESLYRSKIDDSLLTDLAHKKPMQVQRTYVRRIRALRVAVDEQLLAVIEDRGMRLVEAGRQSAMRATRSIQLVIVVTGVAFALSATLSLFLLRAIQRAAMDRARDAERFRHQAEALARSNEELEQFAFVASHDLKEPLRMVTSYVQLLQKRFEGKLGADGDLYIHHAASGAKRMYALVNDLLLYSRTGRVEQALPVDCNAAFDLAVENLQPRIQESKARVTRQYLPTVPGNLTQLTQLFQNLIDNAIKYRRDEAPRIEARVERRRDFWEFSVTDNGIGMDPRYTDKIFVIFQRLHGRGEYSGTGIGLAICKRIVLGHGGRIWVSSSLGQGSTFHFTLPVSAAVLGGETELAARRVNRA